RRISVKMIGRPRGRSMETIWQDLRYAARSLAKQPAFTVIVVLTLAVGIGANTAIFSVVNATLLRPFSFKDPDQLMKVSMTTRAMRGRPPGDNMVWSFPKYQTIRELQRVFKDVALYSGRTYNLTGVEQAERLQGELVTAAYFSILSVTAAAGR